MIDQKIHRKILNVTKVILHTSMFNWLNSVKNQSIKISYVMLCYTVNERVQILPAVTYFMTYMNV